MSKSGCLVLENTLSVSAQAQQIGILMHISQKHFIRNKTPAPLSRALWKISESEISVI